MDSNKGTLIVIIRKSTKIRWEIGFDSGNGELL